MSKLEISSMTVSDFNKLHYHQNMSVCEIAETYDTYPNKVRRAAKKLGATIRNKQEAQKIALQTGRQSHPTKGKVRSDEVKIKISESIAKSWENLPEEEKERRAEMAQQQYANMTVEQRKNLRTKAHEGIIKASKFGSKLEKEILGWLTEKGFQVVFHKNHMVGNEKMHIDIMLPKMMTIIEIDGPSHSRPIWGTEQLKKSQNADNRKDGILLNRGFFIIRVSQEKDLTKKNTRDILIELEKVLSNINGNPAKQKQRRFTIGV